MVEQPKDENGAAQVPGQVANEDDATSEIEHTPPSKAAESSPKSTSSATKPDGYFQLLSEIVAILPRWAALPAFVLALLVFVVPPVYGQAINDGGPLAWGVLGVVFFISLAAMTVAVVVPFAHKVRDTEAKVEISRARQQTSKELMASIQKVLVVGEDRGDADDDRVVVWSRPVPQLPLPSETISRLQTGLRAIQNETFVGMHGKHPSLKIEDVRTNIIVPETQYAKSGTAFELKIHPSLHLGAYKSAELAVSFLPHEGVCGKVFAEQRPAAAIRRTGRKWLHIWLDDASRFEYDLTLEQEQQVARNLKCVLSFPLQIAGAIRPRVEERQTVAVASVDIMRTEIDDSSVWEVHRRLDNTVEQMSSAWELAGFDRVTVVIQRAR